MHTWLTLGASAVYFVLAASVLAVLPALIAWAVLRWASGGQILFNRAYYAALLWTLGAGVLALAAVIVAGKGQIDPHHPWASPWVRGALLADLLLGTLLIWRLVPVSRHRLALSHACLGAAAAIVPLLLTLVLYSR